MAFSLVNSLFELQPGRRGGRKNAPFIWLCPLFSQNKYHVTEVGQPNDDFFIYPLEQLDPDFARIRKAFYVHLSPGGQAELDWIMDPDDRRQYGLSDDPIEAVERQGRYQFRRVNYYTLKA